jgi:hypothetical protein
MNRASVRPSYIGRILRADPLGTRQKFVDEYGIGIISNRVPSTPAEPGSVLKKEGIDDDDDLLSPEDQARYIDQQLLFYYI